MMLHDEYVQIVQNNERPTCDYTKLMVKRFLQDLEKSGNDDYPYYLDLKEVERINKIVHLHKHVKGHRFSRKPFIQKPWQAFIRANVYGWKKKSDGYRRFRKAHIEVPRKNGKSTDRAIDCSIGLLFDKEPGSEVYTVATKRDQARICYDISREQIKQLAADQPRIAALVNLETHTISVPSTMSKFTYLASEAKSMDGTNPHVGVVDEWGAHTSIDQYKSVETGMIGRDNSILWSITTAYGNLGGPCYNFRKGAIQVLEGSLQSAITFIGIWTIDIDDDWHDPECWLKANPGAPDQPKIETLQKNYEDAINFGPTHEAHFKTKHLNIWTRSSIKYINDDTWQKNGGDYDLEKLRGRPCYMGMDLSVNTDLTSLVFFFPAQNDRERHIIKAFNYVPEATVDKRSKAEGVEYQNWIRDGYVKSIPGKIIQHDVLYNKIEEMAKKFEILKIAYDNRFAHQLVDRLEKANYDLYDFKQSASEFSQPIQTLYNMADSKQLNHGNDPAMRWMLSNVQLREFHNAGTMFSKKDSTDRIDGIVALAMAVGVWEKYPSKQVSKYETDEVTQFKY